MQTTINKKDFINALTIGGAMAGKNKTLPILEFAKVDVTADTLSVHSFNGESWVSKQVKIEGTSATDSFCINHSELIKVLKTLAEEVVTFIVDGHRMVIDHFKGTMEMAILPSETYPIEQNAEDGAMITLNADKIKEWISIANNFVATDGLRPVMCGMYLYAKDGQMGMCATDAHKLFTDSVDSNSEEFGVIIPASGFKPLLSIISDVDEVCANIGAKNISFTTADSKLHCRLVEGAYPNFNAVIPKNNSVVVKGSKSELLDSVNRASLMTNKVTSLLKLSVKDAVMGIEGSDIAFSTKAHENVNVEKSGNDVVIGIKAEYCSTCLNIIDSETVILKLEDENKPILFFDSNYNNRIMLVMPMKF